MDESDTERDYGWIDAGDPMFDTPECVLWDNTEWVDAMLRGEFEP